MLKLCRKQGIHYTRYCDDLCFSGNFDAEALKKEVTKLLIEEGFFPNRKKTKVQKRGARQCVTGVVVNEHAAVPAEYRKKIRQELYYIGRFGLRSHMERTKAEGSELSYLRKLLGRISYCLEIDPGNKEMKRGMGQVLELIGERTGRERG